MKKWRFWESGTFSCGEIPHDEELFPCDTFCGAGGHEAIREWFGAWLPDPNVTNSFKPEVIEVVASGELAYERGTYEFAIGTEAGRIEDIGRYLVIWKKIEGEWKAAVDISNSDLLLAGE